MQKKWLKFFVLPVLLVVVAGGLNITNLKAEEVEIKNFLETTTITSPNSQDHGQYGVGVEISDNGLWVFVGAPVENNQNGRVYVYRVVNNQLALVQTINDPYPSKGLFGRHIAYSDNQLAISSQTSGRVSMYKLVSDHWVWTQTLNVSNKSISSISLLNDTLAVGMLDFPTCGLVIVYKEVNGVWGGHQALLPPTCSSATNFGAAVNLDGDYLAVTDMPYILDEALGNVVVYKLVDNRYTFEAKMTPSDSTIGDGFGMYMTLEGNKIFIGACYAETNGTDTGAVYVYEKGQTGWTQTQRITSNIFGSGFGTDLDVRGNLMLVGASHENTFRGSIYIYTFNGQQWVQLKKLSYPNHDTYTYYGSSVALANNSTFISGASGYDNINESDGAAFYYKGNTPSQISPVNGSTVYGKPVILTWETFNVGTYYQVKMKGKYISWQSSGVVKGSYDVSSFTFRAGEVYTWNVRACMDSKCIFASPWSTPSTFVWRPAFLTPTATPTATVAPSGTTIPTPTARPAVD